MPAERQLAGYIDDTALAKGSGFAGLDLQSATSPSAIGRLVYQRRGRDPLAGPIDAWCSWSAVADHVAGETRQ